MDHQENDLDNNPLIYTRNQTDEICLQALRPTGEHAIRYVKDPPYEVVMAAINGYNPIDNPPNNNK